MELKSITTLSVPPSLVKGSEPVFIPKNPTARFKGKKTADIIVNK
jgi:hypothetical protein